MVSAVLVLSFGVENVFCSILQTNAQRDEMDGGSIAILPHGQDGL
jgi:hypothetical protein